MTRAIVIAAQKNSRTQLERMLGRLGVRCVLSAGNAEAVRRRIQTPGPPASFVLFDVDGFRHQSDVLAEIAGLLEFIRREWRVPVLVVGTPSEIQVFDGRIPYLRKPFQASELFFAVGRACRFGDEIPLPIIYVGWQLPESLSKVLGKETRLAGYVDEMGQTANIKQAGPTAASYSIRVVHDPSSLRAEVQKHGRCPVAILVDPHSPECFAADWLKRFKMTPVGQRSPVVCLDTDPQAVQPIRTIADLFCGPDSWPGLLERLRASSEDALISNLICEQSRQAMAAKELKEARLKLIIGLKIAPAQLHLRLEAGRLCLLMGKIAEAANHFAEVIRWNPCLPRAYLMLMRCLPRDQRPAVLEQAFRYCPHHPEIRLRSQSTQAKEVDSAKKDEWVQVLR